ncbi:hypothetical protein VKS41_008112 [Umbelopsis sp. WA50703]
MFEIDQYSTYARQMDHQPRLTPPALIASPPELLHDSGEDESDDDMQSPYFSSPHHSLPLPLMMQKESAIRSNAKPVGSFEDSYQTILIQNGSAISRQNHLSVHHHRTKLSTSPEDSPNSRRKSVPHRSPAAIHDALQATALDKSIVFQLNVPTDIAKQDLFDHYENIDCKPQVICGESLLTALRTKVTSARHERRSKQSSPRQRTPLVAHKIHIPRSPKINKRRKSPEAVSPSELAKAFTDMSVYTSHEHERSAHRRHVDYRSQLEEYEEDQDEVMSDRVDAASTSDSDKHTASPRSKSKGPCQACQEISDGCMRKGFNWPFESSLIYHDKGKPFVYLCNKCGLRYNKSNGCVCRNCRWVFCKEEKRKALQHIEKMRNSRPDGKLDMDEFIEGFVCSPKYWSCGQKWRVGWVLNANANE